METTSGDPANSLLSEARRRGLERKGFCRGISVGCCLGVVLAVVSSIVTWVAARSRHQDPSASPVVRSGKVGVAPLIPTMCNTLSTSSTPTAVLVEIDGKPYAMIPDTGSSNSIVASSVCGAKCDVRPQWKFNTYNAQLPRFEIFYGTGGAMLTETTAVLSLGGVVASHGSFGAIIDQYAGTDGFNLFPAASDPVCYNSYAGILGLAYRGQAAGPVNGSQNATTNGTTTPLLDQLVTSAGMPNGFAIELCARYPQPCGPRRDLETWASSRSCDVNCSIGNLYLGGYRSSSLAGEMLYTPISDEIHYDVILHGIEVCGDKGCKNVSFPDEIGGATEDHCHCNTTNCSIPLSEDEYCYFTVVDSGADGLYMNTVNNTKALLQAMSDVEMVTFPPNQKGKSHQFYFAGAPVLGAKPSPSARFRLLFPGMDGRNFGVVVSAVAIFRQTMAGLVQMAVQSDLQAAAAFQAAKFPVLLGSTVLEGKVVYFDRSRKRLGFANVRPERCGAALSDEAEIDVRSLAVGTPGSGCRRGTGSGGGCPQAHK